MQLVAYSWHPAKQSILKFVAGVTREGAPTYTRITLDGRGYFHRIWRDPCGRWPGGLSYEMPDLRDRGI